MANDSKTWRCGKYELSFDRPRIMGVLNVTPDSMSDGGEHFDQDAAIEYGLAMLDAGADIIDVGGESTRPGFTPVNPDEEARRVLPVVRASDVYKRQIRVMWRLPRRQCAAVLRLSTT